MVTDESLKKVIWVGSSCRDLRSFPEPVQDHIGYALYVAQSGGKHSDAKTLRGFGGAGVVEVVSDYRGDTFRTVYQAAEKFIFAAEKQTSGAKAPSYFQRLTARLKSYPDTNLSPKRVFPQRVIPCDWQDACSCCTLF